MELNSFLTAHLTEIMYSCSDFNNHKEEAGERITKCNATLRLRQKIPFLAPVGWGTYFRIKQFISILNLYMCMSRQNMHGAWYHLFILLYGAIHCFKNSENHDTNGNYLYGEIKLVVVFPDPFYNVWKKYVKYIVYFWISILTISLKE